MLEDISKPNHVNFVDDKSSIILCTNLPMKCLDCGNFIGNVGMTNPVNDDVIKDIRDI